MHIKHMAPVQHTVGQYMITSRVVRSAYLFVTPDLEPGAILACNKTAAAWDVRIGDRHALWTNRCDLEDEADVKKDV
jgi:hypothetical protein